MQFRLINDIRCVNLEEVGEFLKYKNIKAFITRISKKIELLENKFVEVSKLIISLRKNTREGMEELLNILLGNNHVEKINELRKEVVKECDNRVTYIYDEKISNIMKNIHTILSSYKLEKISYKKCKDMLFLYGFNSVKQAIYELDLIVEDTLPLNKEEIKNNKIEEMISNEIRKGNAKFTTA